MAKYFISVVLILSAVTNCNIVAFNSNCSKEQNANEDVINLLNFNKLRDGLISDSTERRHSFREFDNIIDGNHFRFKRAPKIYPRSSVHVWSGRRKNRNQLDVRRKRVDKLRNQHALSVGIKPILINRNQTKVVVKRSTVGRNQQFSNSANADLSTAYDSSIVGTSTTQLCNYGLTKANDSSIVGRSRTQDSNNAKNGLSTLNESSTVGESSTQHSSNTDDILNLVNDSSIVVEKTTQYSINANYGSSTINDYSIVKESTNQLSNNAIDALNNDSLIIGKSTTLLNKNTNDNLSNNANDALRTANDSVIVKESTTQLYKNAIDGVNAINDFSTVGKSTSNIFNGTNDEASIANDSLVVRKSAVHHFNHTNDGMSTKYDSSIFDVTTTNLSKDDLSTPSSSSKMSSKNYFENAYGILSSANNSNGNYDSSARNESTIDGENKICSSSANNGLNTGKFCNNLNGVNTTNLSHNNGINYTNNSNNIESNRTNHSNNDRLKQINALNKMELSVANLDNNKGLNATHLLNNIGVQTTNHTNNIRLNATNLFKNSEFNATNLALNAGLSATNLSNNDRQNATSIYNNAQSSSANSSKIVIKLFRKHPKAFPLNVTKCILTHDYNNTAETPTRLNEMNTTQFRDSAANGVKNRTRVKQVIPSPEMVKWLKETNVNLAVITVPLRKCPPGQRRIRRGKCVQVS